jgi:hypothetical protein
MNVSIFLKWERFAAPGGIQHPPGKTGKKKPSAIRIVEGVI